MIRIYDKDETDFSHDGLEVLDDLNIFCESDRKTNSVFFLEAEFIRDNDKSNSIRNENIIKVPSSSGVDQLFRIKKVKPKKHTISIYAKHIFFDNDDNFIEDTNIVSKDGRSAISQLLGATQFPHRFRGTSNISKFNNARIVRKNLTQALLSNDDNSFLNRWGGELDVNNFEFSINTECGMDRGVEITYGHNTKYFEGEIDETGITTRIMPLAYNGRMLPEKYVDSPLINAYSNPKVKEVSFSHIKLQEDCSGDEVGYKTVDELNEALRKACNDLYEIEKIDKPAVNLTLDVIALEKTDQFKDELIFEKIFFGDTLKVNLAKYGFDVSVRIISERYDCKRDRFIEIEVGQTKGTIFKDVSDLKDSIDRVVDQLGGNSWQDILDKSMEEASQLIAEGVKDSYVVARKNEILIMDSPEVESALNVIRMNKNGIAFSRNGYNGPYTLAITIDGKINASCIVTGELNAALIKVGTLQSANAKTWINMENGTFNFAEKITYDGSTVKILLSDGKDVNEKFTEVITDSEKFKVSVGQSGGSNLLKNGRFLNGLSSWWNHEYNFNGTNKNRYYDDPTSDWCLDGRNTLVLTASNSTTGQYGIAQSVRLKKNCTYTFNGYGAAHRANFYVYIQRNGGDWWVPTGHWSSATGGKEDSGWEKWALTFTTDAGGSDYNFHLAIKDCGADGYAWLTDITLTEGNVKQKWNPHESELYATDFVVDGTGATVRNGNFSIENKAGKKVFFGDSNGNVTLDGDMRIGQNFYIRNDGNIFSVDANAYFQYFRCDEPWARSKEYPGRLNPIVQSRYGIYNGNWNGYAINQINWTDFNGFQALEMWNTYTNRTERIALYKGYYESYSNIPIVFSLQEPKRALDVINEIKYIDNPNPEVGLEIANQVPVIDIDNLSLEQPLLVTNLDGFEGLGLNINTIIPFLTKSISELKKENEILKEELSLLKTHIGI